MGVASGDGNLVTWVSLIAASGSVIALVTFWMNWASRITSAEKEASEAKATVALLNGKHEILSRDIVDYRIGLEARIATVSTKADMNNSQMMQLETRIAKGLDEVKDIVGSLQGRLDRILENQKKG